MSEAFSLRDGADGRSGAVAGVDGCRGGWLYVVARIDAHGLKIERCEVATSFKELIEATKNCDALAVDIPIGLSAGGRREADFEARKRLGPRRSSVFPAPARCLIETEGDYATLNALSKRECGRGISRETCNILPKIAEVDACITPAMQRRIAEAHPELAFWCLNDCTHLQYAKKRPEGLAMRLRLLESRFGSSIARLPVPRGAARDDLYDAAVLTRTAARLISGDAVRLPAKPHYDARGLRMEIVY